MKSQTTTNEGNPDLYGYPHDHAPACLLQQTGKGTDCNCGYLAE